MANPGVTIAIWAGIAALVIGGAVIGGVIVSVLNDGESHKDNMMTSPPPAPPPGGRMRAMEEEVQHKSGSGASHFELNKAERALFSTVAHRERTNAKLHR
jgi:hypothetical protein